MPCSIKALLSACVLIAACSSKPKDPPPAPAPAPVQPEPPKPPPSPPPMADITPLVTASNTFGWQLWKQLGTTGNAAMSPASVTTALAMTSGGAKAATLAGMKKVLAFEGDPSDWGKLASRLRTPGRSLELRVANRLFGEKSYKLEAPFVEFTKNVFEAPLEAVDFAGAPDASRDAINTWVAKQTNDRIKNLLPPPSIDRLTKLVLVNAIYFLADWDVAFEPTATQPAAFAGAKQPVPTMHAVGSYKLAKADHVAVLELPYKNADAAMYVVLPDQVDGLAAVEKSLDASRFEAWRSAATEQRVAIALPKFTIDPKDPVELSKPLAALGMADAFDAKRADFTGIAAPPNPADHLFISAVFHKAFVKVDEKGTEAAAATAVVMAPKGAAPAPAIEFKADHPFLFVIVDGKTGLVLFVGRVSQP
ncbi:MAG: serpin family protein [Kofleriaceae bacterium]